MSSTLPTGVPEQSLLPQRKAMKLNQVVDVSRAPAVTGDSLVYQNNGEWAPQDVTPGAGDIIESMLATGAVSTRALADGAVTDVKIGNRTIDDTAAPSTNTNVLTTLLSNLGNMIKQITGKSNWLTGPAITLEALSNHHARHSVGGGDVVTPASIGASDTSHTHPGATTSVAGFLSTADKTKLDGVATGATATPLSTTTPATGTVGGSGAVGTGTNAARNDHQHPGVALVTTSTSGFMSSTDKTKLDSVASSAAALSSSIPGTETFGTLGAAGAGSTAARIDHIHPMPSAAGVLTALLTVDGAGSSLDADLLDGHDSAYFQVASGSVLPDATPPFEFEEYVISAPTTSGINTTTFTIGGGGKYWVRDTDGRLYRVNPTGTSFSSLGASTTRHVYIDATGSYGIGVTVPSNAFEIWTITTNASSQWTTQSFVYPFKFLTFSATSDLTLTTTPTDIPNCTTVLRTPGTWKIIGIFDFDVNSVAGDDGQTMLGYCISNSVQQSGEAHFISTGRGRATVMQIWNLDVPTVPITVKLQAEKSGGTGTSKARITHTNMNAEWIKET